LCSYTTHGREIRTLYEHKPRAKSLTQSAPTQTIKQPDTDPSAFDCILGNILEFMLPFFLVSAGGNAGLARTAIKELINAYQASTPAELDLVGRIIGFSIAAMDNLRLSMASDLSATKVLRYRCNAATLSRSSDQALKILEAVQARQEQSRKIPRPSVAAAPSPPPRAATLTMSAPSVPSPRTAISSNAGLTNGGVSEFPAIDIETMKRDARIMMAAFSKNDTHGSTTIPPMLDPAASAMAAARAAIATARRASPR
jgi:hypothetical protein